MISEKMLLFVESHTQSKGGMRFFLVPPRYEYYPGDETIKVGEVDVFYDVPEGLTANDLRIKAIQTLKDKQERVIAEAQVKKNKLQERINELLLLTESPNMEVAVDNVVSIVQPKDYEDDIPF